jgi:hypothetical protein
MRLRKEKEEGRLVLFLHDLGYNFFTINALTLAECNILVKAFNAREKEKEREYKKNQKKR